MFKKIQQKSHQHHSTEINPFLSLAIPPHTAAKTAVVPYVNTCQSADNTPMNKELLFNNIQQFLESEFINRPQQRGIHLDYLKAQLKTAIYFTKGKFPCDDCMYQWLNDDPHFSKIIKTIRLLDRTIVISYAWQFGHYSLKDIQRQPLLAKCEDDWDTICAKMVRDLCDEQPMDELLQTSRPYIKF